MIHWVSGRVNLNIGTKHCSAANGYLRYIQYHAIEIEKNFSTYLYVEPTLLTAMSCYGVFLNWCY